MNTPNHYSHTHKIAWTLVPAIVVLAAMVAVTSALTSGASGSQDLKPTRLGPTPAAQAAPIHPDCQDLPECGYIRAHAVDQSVVGSGPVGQMSAPVLTPACDVLAECGYIRAHIPADAGTQP